MFWHSVLEDLCCFVFFFSFFFSDEHTADFLPQCLEPLFIPLLLS